MERTKSSLSEKAIEFQHALKKVREVEDIRKDKGRKDKSSSSIWNLLWTERK